MNIGYVIFGMGVVWVIYYLAWRHGASIGYHDGWSDGYKKGKEDGMALGIKAGIKEQLVNSLAGGGALSEMEQQVRRELLASLNAKSAAPPKPAKARSGLLPELWQRFGWWAVLCVIIALVAYLGR